MAKAGARAGGRRKAALPEEGSAPKTTRAAAPSRREPENPRTPRLRDGRKMDAMPDRIDIRDWFYRPGLAPLPPVLVNCDRVPAILDQGKEGACTGYALAAVINFHLAGRLAGSAARRIEPVSPRMLYEMARRYDEWPGEAYEGSSARGAMKGWVRHGVVPEGGADAATCWPRTLKGHANLTPERARAALRVPGGAFYRVSHRQIRDMHAALAEAGILFATLMVHDGWGEPGPERRVVEYVQAGEVRRLELPVIARRGKADSGHAVAIVGYTAEGFVIQNSWGTDWGAGGFALLPYADYALHATDVWVAQLGVPVSTDIWANSGPDTTAGAARAAEAVPLAEIRPFIVDVGNDGALSSNGDYWTTEADVRRLFQEVIPERTRAWKRRRVMLYLHGGLNSERAAAARVLAMRDVLLANEIYPLHIMWESGAMEAVRNIVEDVLKAEARAGDAAGEWLRRVREGLVDAKDWSFELTAALPGGALWREMKENARLSSEREGGAVRIMAREVKAAIAAGGGATEGWEMHVVAHSAGSIYAAHAMPHLLGSGIPLRSLHLMAPAMTVELFRETLLPLIAAKTCPAPDTYVLSDLGERDDDVGPYGKSLLYLVSNAFEARRHTPLLGMEKFVRKLADRQAAEEQGALDAAVVRALAPGLVVAGEPARGALGPSRSDSHGGFDNDPDTLNSILRRILGKDPARPFVARDLQY